MYPEHTFFGICHTGQPFYHTLSAVVVCPSLDISTAPTLGRIITGLSRPALQAHLTSGDGGLVIQGSRGSELWRPTCDLWILDWRLWSDALRTDRLGGNSWQWLRRLRHAPFTKTLSSLWKSELTVSGQKLVTTQSTLCITGSSCVLCISVTYSHLHLCQWFSVQCRVDKINCSVQVLLCHLLITDFSNEMFHVNKFISSWWFAVREQ